MGKILQFKKTSVSPEPTFKDFAQQIMAGDMASAEVSLAFLLHTDTETASQGAKVFYKKCQENQMTFPKLMSMRTMLEEGENFEVIKMLDDLFEIRPPAALEIITHLARQYGKTTN